MKLKHIFAAAPAALFILGGSAAYAGQTINETGAIACVSDKWDEREPEKGHKLVDFAGRSTGPALSTDGRRFYFTLEQRMSNVRWAELHP